MKKVILDSSFILTCVKQKIDFFEELKLKGLEIIIPKQVIREIKGMNNQNSRLSLRILEKNKFKKVDLGKGKVDNLLINFAKENSGAVIATLDREIKKKTQNPKLIIKGKKKLEII